MTDDGLANLGGLTDLRFLSLSGTRVTDAGLAHLRNCDLFWLSLDRTEVSDGGLHHLEKMSHLRRLNLVGTRVTHNGERMVWKMFPNQNIQIER